MAEESLPPDARAAMRAFLQRAEVRLSTMHRIAGVFINGAGLLFLFPILVKDAVREIMISFMSQSATWHLALVYLALSIPFVISLFIPIIALYLLIRDLVYRFCAVKTRRFQRRDATRTAPPQANPACILQF